MKNQNNMTRQEYKKGAICGGLLAAFAAWFIHCVLDNREIPIVNEFVRRDALPGCILIGVVILIIGFCVMVRNISRLNQLDRQDRNRGAGAGSPGDRAVRRFQFLRLLLLRKMRQTSPDCGRQGPDSGHLSHVRTPLYREPLILRRERFACPERRRKI